MKKTYFLVVVLLLALAVVAGGCQLPAPGGTPPTEPPAVPTAEPTQSGGSIEAVVTQPPPTAYPEPVEPTATAVPPVPTAVPPTQAPTAAPPPQAQRIQFVSGATSATVAGELSQGGSASYVLNIAAGQTLNAQVWSPNNDVYLSLMGSDGQVLLDGATHQNQWVGTLNVTQDYYLTVTAGNGKTSYSVTVVIPPASQVSPTPVASPTLAPTLSAGAFDPYKTYGTPDFEDVMDKNSALDWALPDGTLPDTQQIRLYVDGDKFLVTGKVLDYSTWWFNWASLQNFYIEMSVDARTCSGSDAYGLILRGPEHQAGVSYGYVVSFTCDGKLWVFRLDGVEPWSSTDLVSPTANAYIVQGSGARNVIGVKAIGDTFTVYANGYQVAQFVDRHYLEGRYGLFVRPDVTDFYTYEAVKIAYWIFE
jgi:hypothetical protein